VHSAIRRRVSGRRAAGVAAGLIMAGGLAGTMLAGTANAIPIIFATTTSITATSQAQQGASADPAVTVHFAVTASGGDSWPAGQVTIRVAGQWQSCHADLTHGAGLTSTGSCDLSDLNPGSYTLRAQYGGASQYAKSASGNHALTITSPSGRNAWVKAKLSCPTAVNAGRSGTCKLTVTNDGPGTAVNVLATITLPSDLHARYCGNLWWWNQGCSLRHNIATSHLGNLKAWQAKSLTVHFTAAGNRWSWHTNLAIVLGSAAWGVNFPAQGPMQHIVFARDRVEIRPWGFDS